MTLKIMKLILEKESDKNINNKNVHQGQLFKDSFRNFIPTC